MPPMFYTPPTIATPSIPSIPFFQEIDTDNNSTFTENIDSISTTTPKNNFFVSFFYFLQYSNHFIQPRPNIHEKI